MFLAAITNILKFGGLPMLLLHMAKETSGCMSCKLCCNLHVQLLVVHSLWDSDDALPPGLSVRRLHPKWLTRCSSGSGTLVVVPLRELKERRRRLSRAVRHCQRPPLPTLQQPAVHMLGWLLLPRHRLQPPCHRHQRPRARGASTTAPTSPSRPWPPRPCLRIGDPSVEVTEESRDACHEAKCMAMEALSQAVS